MSPLRTKSSEIFIIGSLPPAICATLRRARLMVGLPMSARKGKVVAAVRTGGDFRGG
jgi:hypothetical protein